MAKLPHVKVRPLNRTTLGVQASFQKGYAFKSGWYTDVGQPIVKVSDFTDASVDPEGLVCISPEVAQNYVRYRLQTNDVVIQTVGSWPSNPASVVGKVIRIPHAVSGALLNQNAVKLSPSSSLDQQFLFYRLRCPDFKDYIVGTAQGAASQASITLESIRAFEFDLFDIAVQKQIASFLSTYDDLIENNTRRIKILEQMAQMLYREWFVNFRFPDHEKVRMVESEVGQIPKGWEVSKLSSLVETQYGYTESADDSPVGPKYLRGMDINKSSYIQWDSVPYCPIPPHEIWTYKLSLGDIVVIRMADPGKVGIVEKEVEAVFASYLIRLNIRDKRLIPYYLFHFLRSDRYQDYVSGASTGTTRKSASAGVITDINIVIPPPDLTGIFGESVGSMREMLNNLLDQNSNLRKTRDLLLPRLISGELGVEQIEIETANQIS